VLKIFNKIRKQLLDENRTGRYLKYALGEIFLVMVGILLALQVNTWNNNREFKKEELKIMKSLHKEFSKNLIKFDIAFEFHIKRKEGIETIMSIESRELSLDSLRSLIRRVNNNYTFNPYQGIYNSIINSGKIELISNELLKERISSLQDLIIDYQEEENMAFNFARRGLHPVFLTKTIFDNFSFYRGNNEIPTSELIRIKEKFIKLVESDEYESAVIFLDAYMTSIFKEGPILREEMISIIDLLELEIENN
jgi:hypothetical protein